jgi:hypothetical protein
MHRSVSVVKSIAEIALLSEAELSKMEKCLERIPLLKGEGAAKRRVRGEEKHLFTPHPALRATLSLQERDARSQVPIMSNRLKPAVCMVSH